MNSNIQLSTHCYHSWSKNILRLNDNSKHKSRIQPSSLRRLRQGVESIWNPSRVLIDSKCDLGSGMAGAISTHSFHQGPNKKWFRRNAVYTSTLPLTSLNRYDESTYDSLGDKPIKINRKLGLLLSSPYGSHSESVRSSWPSKITGNCYNIFRCLINDNITSIPDRSEERRISVMNDTTTVQWCREYKLINSCVSVKLNILEGTGIIKAVTLHWLVAREAHL